MQRNELEKKKKHCKAYAYVLMQLTHVSKKGVYFKKKIQLNMFDISTIINGGYIQCIFSY